MAVDISAWPTKAEVCQVLGLSLSQVNNLIKQRRLEVRCEKRISAPPIGRINPKDLAREKELRTARETQAHVMPAGAVIPAEHASGGLPAIRHNLGAAFGKRLAFLSVRHVPLWMRYDEAAAFSGLSESRLRELVKAGEIKTERGPRGAVVLRHADLKRYAER